MEGFPQSRVGKMASVLQKCTLFERIVPILTVGRYFHAFHPGNGTLVTLVWLWITFSDMFHELTAQEASLLAAQVSFDM